MTHVGVELPDVDYLGQIRELLKKTGTPQGGSAERNIGALPNLRAAIEQMQQ